ncbi:MAG TPA: hypothetical protein VJ623_09155 [Holophagaceae bacterium]|nr:hypothetical protein [Holophagaceae bacterium]
MRCALFVLGTTTLLLAGLLLRGAVAHAHQKGPTPAPSRGVVEVGPAELVHSNRVVSNAR